MKRIISSLLSIILLLSLVTTTAFAATTTNNLPLLSELTVDECISFVKEQGIQIPDDYDDESIWGEFIQKTISQVEADPNIVFSYNYIKTLEFANAIKDAVNEYYGEVPTTYSARQTEYLLTDSTVYGSWKDSYLNYNCYGYAINKTDNFYSPGDFSDGDFSLSLTIYQMANLVKDDLIELGYSDARVTSTRPTTSSLASGEKAICIRKGDEDFHFMKLSSSTWYHKPGNTHVLKYNYTPSYSREWTNECSFMGVTSAPDTTYDSSIYYIIY